ncbi:energy transducer TonB [Leptolyngbya sp. 7M]|uniref:energy transducer TonB n=1 Tax=Leptolyngbya sp. 7M TaxID=2812896 RepID=UPI001B8B60C9|nr:energy transducer TonB [Leptolyngbya sp. 7M]QYO66397.1 energy transducer TonB [Leptolyngbya sp. 7M]
MADRIGISNFKRTLLFAVIGLAVCSHYVAAQRVAILTPSGNELSGELASAVAEKLGSRIKIDDLDLSRAAAESVSLKEPFNLHRSEAAALGRVLGTTHFILLRAEELRRTSSAIEEYYEAYAALYLVSSATGELLSWQIFTSERPSSSEARKELISRSDTIAAYLTEQVVTSAKVAQRIDGKKFPEVPEPGTPGFQDLRPPMPYRRLRPEYTLQANLYGISATVEAEVSIDTDGTIVHLDVVRWAGFGLDESVISAVRSMNWRPASIGNRFLPMRVLLRYNFVKLEKDEDR